MKNKPEYSDKRCRECGHFTRVDDKRLWTFIFKDNLCGNGVCTNLDDFIGGDEKPVTSRYADDYACMGFAAR